MTQERLRVVFFGTPEFASFILKVLLTRPDIEIKAVVTQPDRPAGKGRLLRQSAVKSLAVEHGLAVLQPDRIKRDVSGFLSALKELGPFDIGIVVAFGQILPITILSVPTAGCINVHASLLPRWRGAAPIQRAIMAGDNLTGVCLMHMEAGLDTGPVYSRVELPIVESDNFGSLHDKLAHAGMALLLKDLVAISRGELKATPQSESGVTYAYKVSNSEAQINWHEPAQQISRLIRALSPLPGAYTLLGSQRLKIFSAAHKKPFQGQSLGNPGTIHYVDSRTLEINCGSGVLALGEVQLEGRKRMNIEEFLRGLKLEDGVAFGSGSR